MIDTPWKTHEISNQFDELSGYALFDTDPALREAVARAGGAWHAEALSNYGRTLGNSFALGELANRYPPELESFDRRGRRIDRVDFHSSWHELMGLLRGAGITTLPLKDKREGRWAAWAAAFYLHGQVESGTLCPATMTLSSIPLLQREPALWAKLGDKLMSDDYDERDIPVAQKRSMWLGMGMTEKQGGSDVRANTTTATPLGRGGRGAEYVLRGHKWFFSAPMCDAHLVVARATDAGLSCFYVPRWREDGSKNPVQVQRLKNKLGNRSNSSSEVEFLDASGILIGEEGRGIPTIIEMATITRLTCVVGSAAMLRQTLVQALHYTRQRRAFGKLLVEQPLMRAVLADLALESEASVALGMRLAQAFERDEHGQGTALDRAWKRIMTPAAKFWVCKRAVELTGEAMEVFGGNGYIDDGIMARMFREAPVNSIWEGSGNVMCLDVMRALLREPDGVQALLGELMQAASMGNGEPLLLREIKRLAELLSGPADTLEAQGRLVTSRLALLAQACLLRRDAPAAVSEAFIATRFGAEGWGGVCGSFDPQGCDVNALLERAFPQ